MTALHALGAEPFQWDLDCRNVLNVVKYQKEGIAWIESRPVCPSRLRR